MKLTLNMLQNCLKVGEISVVITHCDNLHIYIILSESRCILFFWLVIEKRYFQKCALKYPFSLTNRLSNSLYDLVLWGLSLMSRFVWQLLCLLWYLCILYVTVINSFGWVTDIDRVVFFYFRFIKRPIGVFSLNLPFINVTIYLSIFYYLYFDNFDNFVIDAGKVISGSRITNYILTQKRL